MHIQFVGTGAADWDAPTPDDERQLADDGIEVAYDGWLTEL